MDPTGFDVSPEAPWYHWYESGAVPVAVTDRVAAIPLQTVALCGCDVIEGQVQLVVALTSPEGSLVTVFWLLGFGLLTVRTTK